MDPLQVTQRKSYKGRHSITYFGSNHNKRFPRSRNEKQWEGLLEKKDAIEASYAILSICMR